MFYSLKRGKADKIYDIDSPECNRERKLKEHEDLLRTAL